MPFAHLPYKKPIPCQTALNYLSYQLVLNADQPRINVQISKNFQTFTTFRFVFLQIPKPEMQTISEQINAAL